MKHQLYTYLLLISITLVVSCGKRKELSSTDYLQWVENPENGLKKEKKVGEYSFRAFLKPADYVVCREIYNSKSDSVDYPAAQKRIESLQNMHLFNFDIVSADGKVSVLQHEVSGQEEYASRINYFVSHAQQDFALVQGKDTMPCALYHFEQTFGLSALNTISLGFEKNENAEGDLQLIYSSRLFNSGEIKFLYPENKLKSIPKLNL